MSIQEITMEQEGPRGGGGCDIGKLSMNYSYGELQKLQNLSSSQTVKVFGMKIAPEQLSSQSSGPEIAISIENSLETF